MNKKIGILILITILIFVGTSQAIEINCSYKEKTVETKSLISQDDPFEDTGTVRYYDLEGGFYGIVADVGQYYDELLHQHYEPINLPDNFKENDIRVKFTAILRPDIVSGYMWGMPIQILKISLYVDPYENIEFSVKTDKEEYKLRESVHISLQLTNTGTENVTLFFPSSYTHDFIVTDINFRSRYQLSNGKAFICTITSINITAGETYYINRTWNQKGTFFHFMQRIPDIFCHQLRPGDYFIIGAIPTTMDSDKDFTYTDVARISLSLW